MPFENLDIHIGRSITIDVDRFVTKVVHDRRGGFCYELNGAFAWLLERLGFEVDRLEARVHGIDGPTRPFDHLCLQVTAPGHEPVLADVGFGDSFDAPLALTFGSDQRDSNGVFRLDRVSERWIDLASGGAPVYRAARVARRLDDFATGCAFHQSPDSHFTKNTVCSLRTATGRVTLRGLTLVRTVDGVRRQDTIAAADLGAVLDAEFGVHLPAADLDRLGVASHA